MANPRIEVEIGAKINEFERKFNEVDKQLDNTGKQFNKLNEFATGALQGIAAAFTVGAVVNFGKAVLDTTAKFQKFEAVLTNTLGSQSEAQNALLQISKFASETPFQVDELTSAFVKLANQGFTPTISQLRSLGDLAASTGKSFDQLAEAIIDAQVGEFERLKEFGIRAQKEGDNVKFTFKGVETQVKNTNEAIREYVLSLGDAEGVSGAMAKISETLGGKISNLQDNIEALRLAVGNQTSGVFAASIDWLNEFTKKAILAAQSIRGIREGVIASQDANDTQETRKEVEFLVKKLSETLPIQEAINRAVDLTKESYKNLSDDISKGTITAGKLGSTLNELEKIRVELLKEQKKENKELTEEEKKKLEANQKFYNSAIELSTQYSEKIQEEFSATRLVVDARKKLEEASQSVVKSINARTQVVDVGVNVSGFTPTDLTPQLDESKLTAFILRLQEFNDQVAGILEGGIEATIGDFAFAIGDALASGGNVLKAAGSALLGGLAQILNQLGQLAIGTGIAIAGIKKALQTLNPAVAIGAGVALVALAGFVSAKARSLGGFGRGAGGASSVGDSGVGGGSAFTGGGQGLPFNPNSVVVLETVVRGEDILFVSQQANNRINKG